MSEKQWRKAQAAERIIEGTWSLEQGAQALGLSGRQMRRICARVGVQGAPGVLHAGRGRTPANRLDEAVIDRILGLMQGKYLGFNDTHACEKLRELEGILVGRETLRRILRQQGLVSPQKRHRRRVFRRRQPKEQEGMLLQWDGSRHDWLEGRGPPMCLMGAVDDATGKLLKGAHFVAHESSAAYLRALQGLVLHHGIPWSIYMDRHSCLKRNDDHWSEAEQLQGHQQPTQVGRALGELDIEAIYAMTPQAKGRVERMWGTLQDRLVSELRLENACTLEQADEVLQRFRKAYNQRFGRCAKNQTSAWRKRPEAAEVARICAFSVTRLVHQDHTIRYEGMTIDLTPWRKDRCLAGEQAELRHLLDGTMLVSVKGRKVALIALEAPKLAPTQARRPLPPPRPGKKPKLSFAQIRQKYRPTEEPAEAI